MNGHYFAAVANSSSNRRRPSRRASVGASIQLLERRFLLTAVVVNTTLDGIFPPASGIISLRNAVETANSSTTPTTISFSSTVFATPQTIILGGKVLDLSNASHPTTIRGPAAGVKVSGNGQTGGFQIENGVAASFTGVSVVKASNGGIQNFGGLHITNGTISGNTGAGGIVNYGTVFLTNVTVSGNAASGADGGGIRNNGTATLVNVTVSGNTDSTGFFGGGGGIFNYNSATLTVTNAVISGNSTSSSGGGIYTGGECTLTNVTIVGNTSSTGGGIYSFGTSTFTNVTIFGNTSSGDGGGIYDYITSPTIANSIVAGNLLKGSGNGPDAKGGFNSLGYNLVGKTDGSTGWNAADLIGTVAHPLSPKLGSLASNGGSTQSMLPSAGSPAIDHGLNLLIPKGVNTDQRGFPRIANGTVDIGAVEVQPPTGSIAGNVFVDANANGKLDTGEKHLAGVKVYIDTNKSGALDSGETSIVIDAAGNFKFANLAAGTYRVREVLPGSYAITAPAIGYFDVALKAGQAVSGLLFADAPATASVSGRVFNDANGNGLRDPGEMGLGLWQVFIDRNNNGKIDGSDIAVTTDINGNWSFKGQIAGTYTLRVVNVAGNDATKPSGGVMTIKLVAGQASSGNLFGEKAIA
jgi:predicted outer membrane repeat protein